MLKFRFPLPFGDQNLVTSSDLCRNFQSFLKTLFQLNIKRFTYSFLTNEFNPHWVIVEDPCKQAMIEKYGIHQGTGQTDEPLAIR